MIKHFGREKFYDTSIERFLADGLKTIGFEPTKKTINCSGGIQLRIDRMIVDLQGKEVCCEALGEVHFTDHQESKTRWRDSLILATDRRVILVGHMYLVPKWELYLLAWLWHAVRNPAFGIDKKYGVQALVS